MKSEPDPGLLPPTLNPKVSDFLRRCLEKNPNRRWHAAGDVRVELETLLAAPHAPVVEEQRVVAPRPLWRRAVPFVLNTALAAAIAAAAAWNLKPSEPHAITRFPVFLDEGQQFTNPGRLVVAISPDGS